MGSPTHAAAAGKEAHVLSSPARRCEMARHRAPGWHQGVSISSCSQRKSNSLHLFPPLQLQASGLGKQKAAQHLSKTAAVLRQSVHKKERAGGSQAHGSLQPTRWLPAMGGFRLRVRAFPPPPSSFLDL